MKTIMSYWAIGKDGSIEEKMKNWINGRYRGELLYGITHLKEEGFGIIFSKTKKFNSNGWAFRITNMLKILRDKREYDIVYAPYYDGLQALIYLRGLRLYKKKIVIWQHMPIEKPRGKNFFRRFLYRVFINGIDKFIFFSENSRNESLHSGIISENKTAVLNWGPDLDFFKNIMNETSGQDYKDIRFISTGMWYRDFDILIKAFTGLSVKLDIYLIDKTLIESYKNVSENISIHFIEPNELSSYRAALEASKSSVIVICTKPVSKRKQSFGLTSLIEASALGKPVVVTRNRYIPQYFEESQIGLFVNAGNADELRRAIIKISSDNDLLLQLRTNSSEFALKKCNLQLFTQQLASLFENI